MAKIIIKNSEISSSAGINIPGNLSIAGDTVIGDLFTDSLIINAHTTFNEDVSAEEVVISSSFKGDGSQLHSITASNVSNFANDVRAQFSAGTNIAITGGVISSTGGSGGTPGGTNTTVQFNSGSTFSGSTNLIYNYATNILSGTTAQFTTITGSNITGSTARFTTVSGTNANISSNMFVGSTIAATNINSTHLDVIGNTNLDNAAIRTGGESFGTLTVGTIGTDTEGGIVLIPQDANDVAINYAGDYKVGIDTSDGDNFKISYGQPTMYGIGTIFGGAQLGTNDILIISKALSGSVGIGTSGSLTEKLIVSGNIKATGTGIISGSSGQFTNITGSHFGNSTTATTLQTPRTISSTGDVVWSVTFDGSGNVSGSAAIGSGVIVNADINASAAIADTKLATISTAGKVSNSATTATSANTANAIVARDASGNFTAGTITATLAGNASTVTNGVYTTTIASHATTGVTAGSGLTGGGTVGVLAVNVGAGDGITVAADSVAVDSTVVRTTGNQTIGGLKTFSSYITGSITGSDAKFTSISGSHTGSGAGLTNLTASNISNFTNDVRAQFSAGTNIAITNGQISSTGGATGSVTSVSVVSANGLAGTVANPTTTPAITLSTSVTGLLKGNGTAISAATAGTDYASATSGTSILYGNNSGGFSNATVGTSLSFSAGSLTRAALTGDVTAAANNNATTIATNTVSNTKLADMATATIKGRITAGTGDPEDLTGTQATTLLDTFTSTLKGLAPSSGGGTTNYLRADGNWSAPPAGTVTTVSVVSANGLAGTVANPTTTPAITLSTSVTGLLKGNGTAISAATAGTDYAPAGNYVTTDTVQTITAEKVISVNTASPALRITQTGAGEALRVEDSANPDSTPFVITAGGDVGIGTSSPSQRLTVNGNIATTGSIEANRNDIEQILNSYNSSAGSSRQFYLKHLLGNVELGNDRGNLLITAGSVGINTNATQTGFAKFVVRPATNNLLALTSFNNTGSIIAWNDVGTSNTLRLAGNPLVFTGAGGSGAEHFRIDGTGNVGIGTTNPSARLEIKGTSTGVVQIGPWNTAAGTYGGIYLNGDYGTTNNYNLISSPGDKTLYINRPASANIQFRLANVDQVNIAAAGYTEFSTSVVYDPGSTVNVTADGQAVTVGARSYIQFTSNNVPASRTITLSNGLRVGQILILQVMDQVSTNGIELLDTFPGTVGPKLSDNWSGLEFDTLSLIWDGVQWVETSRSNN
jgi:hypothetical protein